MLATQWDSKKEKVKTTNPNHYVINEALNALYTRTEKSFAELMIIAPVQSGRAIKLASTATHDFYEFSSDYLASLDSDKHLRTKIKYQQFINSIKEFRSRLMIEEITTELLQEYKKFLLTPKPGKEPYKHNTIMQRLKSFRALYNHLPFQNPTNPFDRFVIGSYQPSEQEPLTEKEISLIWDYTPRIPSERLAKDMFLFSFYAAGMRHEDVLTLRWDEIRDDRIVYDQSKKAHLGKNVLSIPLNIYTKEILSRYDKSKPTVFDRVSGEYTGAKAKLEVSRLQITNNFYLKEIAKQLGITKTITFKLARTTFAQIANKKSGRDVYSIKEAMGHGKITTTEIYLGSDQSATDELLKKVYQ